MFMPFARLGRFCALLAASLLIAAAMPTIVFAQQTESADDAASSWLPDAQDARKALPNDFTPPARSEPATMLPPLTVAQSVVPTVA